MLHETCPASSLAHGSFFYEINTTLFKGTILNFELEIWSNNMKKDFRKDKTVPEAHQFFLLALTSK